MRGRCLVVSFSPPHDVVTDLVDGLKARGWDVDWCLSPAIGIASFRPIERALGARSRLLHSAARVARRGLRELSGARVASLWFAELEGLVSRGTHDVILAYVDQLPVGVARLLQRARAPVVFVTLVALRQELRARFALLGVRLLATLGAGTRLHRDLFGPARPSALSAVVLPTIAWQQSLIDAGVSPASCRVIPFGVSLPQTLPGRSYALPSPARLLWVGRLSPEKGLHLFLSALPLVAAHRPVKLTVVAAGGPGGYEHEVRQRMARLAIDGLVVVGPALPRGGMIEAFERHDVLLFHSVFAEPVAQVMLHAAAAGLPIVGPASANPRSLLREDTAACFCDEAPASVAGAILRALDDEDGRRARAARLSDSVRRGHDLARTIEEYDRLLCSVTRQARDRGGRQRA